MNKNEFVLRFSLSAPNESMQSSVSITSELYSNELSLANELWQKLLEELPEGCTHVGNPQIHATRGRLMFIEVTVRFDLSVADMKAAFLRRGFIEGSELLTW